MKFSNHITLQEWKNRRARKANGVLALLSISLIIIVFCIILFSKTTVNSIYFILLGIVIMLTTIFFTGFMITHFSGNSKYSLDKLLKNRNSSLKLPHYEEEFKQADQVTPNIYMSTLYIFSYGIGKRVTIIPIEKIIWAFQGDKLLLQSSAKRIVTTSLIGSSPASMNHLALVLDDRSVMTIFMGRIRPADSAEIMQKLSKELKNRKKSILLGYNDEYSRLYRKDFDSLIQKAFSQQFKQNN